MIIYLDFDGVLFDTVSIILDEIKKNNINLKDNCQYFFENLDWSYILHNAKEINNSVEIVNKLKHKYKIKILTHVSSVNEQTEKENFIKEKIKDIEIICIPKKYPKSSIVSSENNILIDDSKKNVKDWIDNKGEAYLYDGKRLDVIIKKLLKG